MPKSILCILAAGQALVMGINSAGVIPGMRGAGLSRKFDFTAEALATPETLATQALGREGRLEAIHRISPKEPPAEVNTQETDRVIVADVEMDPETLKIQSELDSFMSGQTPLPPTRDLPIHIRKGEDNSIIKFAAAGEKTVVFYVPLRFNPLLKSVPALNTPKTFVVVGWHLNASKTPAQEAPKTWIMWHEHKGRVYLRTRDRHGFLYEEEPPASADSTVLTELKAFRLFLDALLTPRNAQEQYELAQWLMRHGIWDRRSIKRSFGLDRGMMHQMSGYRFRLPEEHRSNSLVTQGVTALHVWHDQWEESAFAVIAPDLDRLPSASADLPWVLLHADPLARTPVARMTDGNAEWESVELPEPLAPLAGKPGRAPTLFLHRFLLFRKFLARLTKRWQSFQWEPGVHWVTIGEVSLHFNTTRPLIMIRRPGEVDQDEGPQNNQVLIIDPQGSMANPLGAKLWKSPIKTLLSEGELRDRELTGEESVEEAFQKYPAGLPLPAAALHRFEDAAILGLRAPTGRQRRVEVFGPGAQKPSWMIQTVVMDGKDDAIPVNINLPILLHLMSHSPFEFIRSLANHLADYTQKPAWRRFLWQRAVNVSYVVLPGKEGQPPTIMRDDQSKALLETEGGISLLSVHNELAQADQQDYLRLNPKSKDRLKPHARTTEIAG